MTNSAKYWWWPALFVVMAIWAINQKAVSIPADISKRVEAELKTGGFLWSKLSVKGRDVTLMGMAPTPIAREEALSKARAVRGVRIVKNEIQTMAVQSPYILSLRKSGTQVVITGYAPNDTTKAAVFDAVKAGMPGVEVLDQQVFAAGAPDDTIWVLGARFAAQQLAKLKMGEIRFSDTDLSLQGTVNEVGGVEDIATTLKTALPQGITVKSSLIIPPTVQPYIFRLVKDARGIMISGLIEDESQRDTLTPRVKAQFSDLNVTDQLKIALGAPPHFMDKALLAIDQLRTLSSGIVEMSDGKIIISGVTTTPEAYSALQTALEGISSDITAVKLPTPQQ